MKISHAATCRNCGRPIMKDYGNPKSEWRHSDGNLVCKLPIKYAEPVGEWK